ncbi:hypothetical protein OAE61_05410 [Verrucomicrobiales bacterium]|nr:hypothetical protein [Verrucomicrobiales bacterium]MDC0314497.1 hypothetical protein [bacterium]
MQRFFVNVDQHDVGTRFREMFSGGKANLSSGSCDNDCFVFHAPVGSCETTELVLALSSLSETGKDLNQCSQPIEKLTVHVQL